MPVQSVTLVLPCHNCHNIANSIYLLEELLIAVPSKPLSVVMAAVEWLQFFAFLFPEAGSDVVFPAKL